MGQSSSSNTQNEHSTNSHSSTNQPPPPTTTIQSTLQRKPTVRTIIQFKSLSYTRRQSEFIQLYSQTIPFDVFSQILMYGISGLEDIVPLFLVNKNWRNICDTERVWQQLAHSFNSSTSELSVSKYLSNSVSISEIQSWKDLVVYQWLLKKYSKKFITKQDLEYLKQYRCVVNGSCESGKSTLLHLLCNGEFLQLYTPTIAVDYHKVYSISKCSRTPFSMHVFECSGQEKFSTITASYYNNRNSHLLIFMYDLDKPVETFEFAKQLLTNAEIDSNSTVCIIGNKSDLKDVTRKPDVSKQVENFCSEYGYHYYECSVKTRPLETYLMFQDICEKVADAQEQQPCEKPSRVTVCH
jgi:small GTP-binding protein